MTTNVRPSGLTAFAIINFIFGGIVGLGVMFSLGAMACSGAFNKGPTAQLMTPEATAVAIVIGILNLVIMGLLVVSGIGYIKCSPVLGRLFGSIYALAEIAKTIVSLGVLTGTQAQFSILTVTQLVWPLLTLVFINLVFSDVWKKRARLADMAGQDAPESSGARGKNPPHLILVMLQSIRQTLRGVQGVLFILITLTVCFITVGGIMIGLQTVQKQVESYAPMPKEQSDLRLKEGVKQVTYGFFVWLLDETTPTVASNEPAKTIAFTPDRDAWADYLTSEKPALLSFIFAVMMTLFPVLAAFLAFNQISEDAKRKGFRYLLLRTNRSSIFFGKFLAALAIIIPIIILTVASVAFFVMFAFRFYPVEDIVTWSLWAIVMLILVSAPSIAFCLLVSALINSGFGSLAAGGLMLGLLPLIARLLKDSAGFMVFLQYLLPQKAAYFLMSPQWWVVLLAAVGCCLYTAVYLGGGYIYFKRKSL
jgi:ABC-type transport system involved in multi-copper enzyme maturation permease subunit